MREAAERRQQLELEHEQALAVLNAKQQEIEVLQKAQVEAKKEHEGAVHLLENHLDSMQAKVRELEEKCRSQTEQFNLLSKELEKFRLQAGKFDILSTDPLNVLESPGSPNKSLSQLLNGLAAPLGKGDEAPSSRSLISEFIRPLQISGDKPEFLSVKPTFLTRGRVSSQARAFLPEMDKELSSRTRSKPRFTGKVRLCIARYSYNPHDGPNENPEAELPLVAGKYLYVYGTMDEDGFYEGELLDGQRGLVPSNFVEFVQDEETPSVQHRDAVAEEPGYLNHSSLGPQRLKLGTGTRTGVSSLLSDSKLDCISTSSLGMELLGSSSNGTGTLDVSTDEVGEDIVPYPRRINLIKQLAKSVIISWDPPVVPPGWGSVSGYNVSVDKELRMCVPYGGRTKTLLEKLNLVTSTYRISVQSVTERGPSDGLRCTLLVGKDVVVAPYYLRVDGITQASAELSWMPSNSNYSHTIFLNGAEYDMVRAGGYTYKFFNLKPMTVYKVKVMAQPHQVPWQLPMDQRDKREISVEFCTQPAVCVLCSSGPPLPPQEVQVQCGQTPGILQVRWKPPPLTSSGTSNGASVIGYAVCTKGQKIAEVLYPTADYVTVELNRIQCLEARELIVRTLSAQGESQDSPVAVIPNNLLGSPRLSHRTTAPPHHTAPPTHPPYPSTYPPNHPQPQVQPPPRGQPHTLPHAQPHAQPVCQPPPHPQPHFQSHPMMPKSKPSVSAREPQSKEHEVGLRTAQLWERSPSPHPPMRGPNLEPPPPHFQPRRSPSPQRILPQPQGAPIPNTVAKAMAREAAQRVFAEGNRVEKRNIFSERGNALHPVNSDEEEDGYDSPHARRRGASVDEFLRGSELGRQHHHHPYGHSEEYHTESSRGSDLSDIMEEDEEDLYSEMQLEEGRRRSINSHNTLKIIGNSPPYGNADRLDHSGRRPVHMGNPPQQRPIPSIDGFGGRRHGRGRRSLEYYEESEPEEMTRVFVALFDYDPMSMSPNPDAADEELPFKEGQIIKVFGHKDTDGFYRAEVRDRVGLIPCNMVSEIQTEDDEMMGQLLKQGFLPLNTPVEKLVNCDRFKDGRSINRRSRKSKRERNRRSGRQHPMSTRRMVALYDYDPRESSPNVDVEYEGNRLNEEAELTFCAGDVITVFGEIDEDGFYYGELNGHKGLVPSNFLEEVPDDVEVFLTDSPSRYPQDTPARIKTKRVPSEKSGPPRRAGSPTVRPHIPGSGPAPVGPGSPIRAPPDMYSSKTEKGLLSKGKTLLQRLGAVK
ncbi:RIMS-binding protein 2 isoform X8 [Pungitius pungitius]|uniref:RIMS-binding protein 2 isoform X8 n=1 Tax=Pungitius pungitius TaxID=134920 RepID=UPI002E137C42